MVGLHCQLLLVPRLRVNIDCRSGPENALLILYQTALLPIIRILAVLALHGLVNSAVLFAFIFWAIRLDIFFFVLGPQGIHLQFVLVLVYTLLQPLDVLLSFLFGGVLQHAQVQHLVLVLIVVRVNIISCVRRGVHEL